MDDRKRILTTTPANLAFPFGHLLARHISAQLVGFNDDGIRSIFASGLGNVRMSLYERLLDGFEGS